MAKHAEMKDLNKTDDEQGGYDLIVLGAGSAGPVGACQMFCVRGGSPIEGVHYVHGTEAVFSG